MKSTNLLGHAVFLIFLLFADWAWAAETRAPVSKAASREGPAVVLVARPEGPAEPWLAVFIEAYVMFRLGANSKLVVVDQDSLVRHIPQYGDPGQAIPKGAYDNICRHLRVTHVLWQNYAVDEGGRKIQHYAEIVRRSDNKLLAELDTSFFVEDFGKYFAHVSVWVQQKSSLAPDEKLKRFFGMDILPETLKDQRLLAETVARGLTATGDQALSLAQELLAIRDRNTRALLAQYYAGKHLARAGAFPRAAKQLREIIDIVPEYASLYPLVCQSLRMSGDYDGALKYAADAEGRRYVSAALLLEKALSLDAQHKTALAQREYERILSIDANEPHALLFHATLSNEGGKYDKALEYAGRALANGGDSATAFLECGRSLAGLGKLDEAIDAFKKATARMPKDATPQEYLGDLYESKGLTETAADYYLRARQLDPKRLRVSLKAAAALEKAGKSKDALAVLKAVESLCRDSAVVQMKIGMLSHGLGDDEAAMRHLERYAQMKGTDGEAYVALGDLHTAKGDYEKAFYYYNHALPLLADKKGCKMALAKFYLRKKEPQAAITLLKQILGEDSKYPEANRYLGDAWLASANPRSALMCYRAAKEANPKDAYVQQRVADLSYQVADKGTAMQEYEKLIELDSSNARAYLRLALTCVQQKKVSRGELFLKKALSLAKASPDEFLELGHAFEEVKQLGRAADMYAEVLRADPKRDDVWLELAAAQRAIGKEAEAAESYVKLFDLDNKKYSAKLADAGHLYEKKGMKREAKKAYELFLEKKFSDPQVSVALAQMEYGEKEYAKVVALLAGLEAKLGGDLETLTMLGVSYAYEKQFAKAAAVFAKVAAAKPTDVQAHEMAARAYEKAGESARAIDMYNLLLELRPKDKHPDYAYAIGQLYEKQKQASKAIERYEKNLSDYPRDVRSHQRLAVLYSQARDWGKVTEVLLKMERMPDAPVVTQRKLAETYLAMGDKVNAVKYYQKYLAKEARDSSAWYELGSIYFARQEYSKAVEPLDNAAKLMPKNFDVLAKAGISYKEVGLRSKKKEDIREALSYLRKASELNAKDEGVLSALAECYRLDNDTKELIAVLTALSQLKPQDLALHTELGSMLQTQGDIDGAAKAFEVASRLKPGDSSLHLLLADLYGGKGDAKAMLSHLDAALKIDSSNPDIHLRLARHYVSENEFGQAETHYKKAMSLRPDDAEGRFEYARVLAKLGKKGSALTELEAALKHDEKNAKYAFEYSRLAYDLGKSAEALDAARIAGSRDSANAAVLAWAGFLFMKADLTDSAKMLLNNAVQLDKSCTSCYRSLGDIYMSEQLFSEAAEAYGNAVSAGGPADTLGLAQGRALLLGANYEGARRVLMRMLKDAPDNDEARYWVVHSYVREGRVDKAQGFLVKDSDRKTGWQYLAEAEVQEAEGKDQHAFVAFGVASRLLPGEGQPQAGLGRLSAKLKNHSSAIIYFGKAMANEPYNSEYVLDMGRSYEAIDEHASALAVYEEALRKSPKDVEIHYLIANVLRKQREYPQAVGAVKKGLKQDPKNAKLHYLLGDIQRLRGKSKDAISAYEIAAKEGGKEFFDAYRQIGLLYYHKLVDNNSAEKYFKKYIRAGGQDKEVDELIKKLTTK